jgi:uncharacterized surface protein with fasciclin (FAS1) repeats
MMKKGFRISNLVIIFLIAGTACEKKFDEYYKVPDDLIGTILDVLEEDGNYSQFIKAVELVEFDDVLGKTGNFTVFAPDDDAFREFFTETGFASLEEIPEEELKSLVYYHIIFWAYSKFMLLYGLGVQDVNIEYSPLNYKHPTRYTPPVTTEFDTLGRKYNVYHETKFIPVYSDEFFKELDLDPAANYTMLYPGSTYGGFNVDRAEIVEYDVPAQNGWIHKIDKVLVPPDNHDAILSKLDDFSIFRELINRNTSYEYSYNYTTAQNNEGDVNEDGVLDSLFLKTNRIFPTGNGPDIENVLYDGHQNMLTIIAPTNSALQEFIADQTKGYSSIYQIGMYWRNWYLQHYISTNYWPGDLDKLTEQWEWDLTSSLVDCNVTEGDIVTLQMASNGTFCGINKYLLPKIFESVAGPVIGDKDYEWFCNMLVFYLVDKLLNEDNLEFTLFAPSNSAIAEAGYLFKTGLGGWGLYTQSDPINPVPRNVASDIVKTHVVFGELAGEDFEPGTFIESSQHTYIGVDQEGGIFAGGDLTPSGMGPPEMVAGKGVVYRIDRMLVAPKYSIFDIISDPNIYPQYQKFYQLCYQSGLMLLDENQRPLSLNNISVGTYYSCFIPTNESIEQGILDGTVPVDADSLQQFLRYHFVEGVIFPDGKASGEFNTTRIDEQSGYLFNTIEIINQKYDLRVRDALGNIRSVINPNHMAQDGVIHQIDSILLYCE